MVFLLLLITLLFVLSPGILVSIGSMTIETLWYLAPILLVLITAILLLIIKLLIKVTK